MSSVSKKMMQAAAGAAGGAEALAIEDVFSTYLYTGNGSTQTITNGIDLAGEGGMVWFKGRNGITNHLLYDTERGAGYRIQSDETAAQTYDATTRLTSFTSSGFTLGNLTPNASGTTYASWTFRKAPRFFDVVTYTGDGTSDRQIAHNLGATVGSVIIKETSGEKNWGVWHRSFANVGDHMYLNTTGAVVNNTVVFGSTLPTETNFNVGAFLNSNGATYVAYLFAHDPNGLIACGSFTTDGSGNATVDLGWEPQWVITKRTDDVSGWFMTDAMRGMPVGAGSQLLSANASSAEVTAGFQWQPNPTGLYIDFTANNATYTYIAIRRGPMRQPTSGTEVFGIDTWGGGPPAFTSGFPVDWALMKNISGGESAVFTRMLGQTKLRANLTDAEVAEGDGKFDYMNGWHPSSITLSNLYSWMFRRAPEFFDVVAYTGDGSSLGHNLAVTPEIIIVKNRGAGSWRVTNAYSNGLLYLEATDASNGTDPFQTLTPCNEATMNLSGVSQSGNNIAYLFATLPGVSKVGSYTGNGTSQTIDCGFTTGARFVLIKRTDASGTQWSVFDSARGIVVGADPVLELDSTAAEVTTRDDIDPDNSGFIVNQDSSFLNTSGGNYIFLAIA